MEEESGRTQPNKRTGMQRKTLRSSNHRNTATSESSGATYRRQIEAIRKCKVETNHKANRLAWHVNEALRERAGRKQSVSDVEFYSGVFAFTTLERCSGVLVTRVRRGETPPAPMVVAGDFDGNVLGPKREWLATPHRYGPTSPAEAYGH